MTDPFFDNFDKNFDRAFKTAGVFGVLCVLAGGALTGVIIWAIISVVSNAT